jgi:hypothetical protein
VVGAAFRWISELVPALGGAELVLGAVLSVVAGCAGVLARRAGGSSFAVSWRWFGPLARIPFAVLADTMVLARLLWAKRQAPAMPLRTVPLARQADEVRGESWQAVAGLMLSLSLGSFVVDSGGQPPGLLVHAVREQPSVVERSMRQLFPCADFAVPGRHGWLCPRW